MAFDRLKEGKGGQPAGLGAVLPSSFGAALPPGIDGAALLALTAWDERLALALLRLFAEQIDLILPVLTGPEPVSAPSEAAHRKDLGLTEREAVHRLYGAARAVAASDIADAAAAALSLDEMASQAEWRSALAVLEARMRALREGLEMVRRRSCDARAQRNRESKARGRTPFLP